jgi:hypothetical protein
MEEENDPRTCSNYGELHYQCDLVDTGVRTCAVNRSAFMDVQDYEIVGEGMTLICFVQRRGETPEEAYWRFIQEEMDKPRRLRIQERMIKLNIQEPVWTTL